MDADSVVLPSTLGLSSNEFDFLRVLVQLVCYFKSGWGQDVSLRGVLFYFTFDHSCCEAILQVLVLHTTLFLVIQISCTCGLLH